MKLYVGLFAMLILGIILGAVIGIYYTNTTQVCLVPSNLPNPTCNVECPELKCECPEYTEQDCWDEINTEIIEIKQGMARAKNLFNQSW